MSRRKGSVVGGAQGVQRDDLHHSAGQPSRTGQRAGTGSPRSHEKPRHSGRVGRIRQHPMMGARPATAARPTSRGSAPANVTGSRTRAYPACSRSTRRLRSPFRRRRFVWSRAPNRLGHPSCRMRRIGDERDPAHPRLSSIPTHIAAREPAKLGRKSTNAHHRSKSTSAERRPPDRFSNPDIHTN